MAAGADLLTEADRSKVDSSIYLYSGLKQFFFVFVFVFHSDIVAAWGRVADWDRWIGVAEDEAGEPQGARPPATQRYAHIKNLLRQKQIQHALRIKDPLEKLVLQNMLWLVEH